MPIEIRELVIKVKIEESTKNSIQKIDLDKVKREILRECKREIKIELNRKNER